MHRDETKPVCFSLIANTTGQVNVIYKLKGGSLEIPTAPVNESLEAIKKLKVEELKKILRDRGQPVTGKKRMSRTL